MKLLRVLAVPAVGLAAAATAVLPAQANHSWVVTTGRAPVVPQRRLGLEPDLGLDRQPDDREERLEPEPVRREQRRVG